MTSTQFYDYRAERLAAAGQAEIAKATAAEIAAQARLRELDAVARADELAEARDARARQHRTERQAERRAARRQAWAAVVAAWTWVQRLVARVLPALAGLVACVAPAVIAFDGQYRFAAGPMGLGLLGVLFPIMLEGVAWRLVWARQQALRHRVDAPTARLTLGIWLTALTGAAMNVWHGLAAGSVQVGVAFGLASLVGFALVEVLNGAHRRHQQGRMAGGVRVTILRWLRFPRLAFAAWSRRIALGPQADTRAAWDQVWTDRYGVGPHITRRERRLARLIVDQEDKDARTAARNGELSIVDGRVRLGFGPTVQAFVDAERQAAMAVAEQAAEHARVVVQDAQDVLTAAGLLFGADALRSEQDSGEPLNEQVALSPRAAELLPDLRQAISAGLVPANPSVATIRDWVRTGRRERLGVPAAQELRDAVKGLHLLDQPGDVDQAHAEPVAS